MICDTDTLSKNSRCDYCIPRGSRREVYIHLLCIISSHWPSNTKFVILPDGSGGFWRLIVDPAGNVGTISDPGPATPDVILSDGVGGFWKIIVDPSGNRGTTTSAGPATSAPVIYDGISTNWTIVVDASGNLGASS